MNRDDVTRMAREAGWVIHDDLPYLDVIQVQDALLDRIERIVNAATAAEREACAKVCEEMLSMERYERNIALLGAAVSIRARGEIK